jgi:hypothetical protein
MLVWCFHSDSTVFPFQVVIQVPSPGDSSGWPDGYEDLESGDNGFPGDMDEGEASVLSRPEIVMVCVSFQWGTCAKQCLFGWFPLGTIRK